MCDDEKQLNYKKVIKVNKIRVDDRQVKIKIWKDKKR